MNSKNDATNIEVDWSDLLNTLVKLGAILSYSSFNLVKAALDLGVESVYCSDPSGKKEFLLVTTIKQAEEYYKDEICNENTPILITKQYNDPQSNLMDTLMEKAEKHGPIDAVSQVYLARACLEIEKERLDNQN